MFWGPDLWLGFTVLFRPVPAFSLNMNAVTDISTEKDVFVLSNGTFVLSFWSGNGNLAFIRVHRTKTFSGFKNGTEIRDFDIFFSRSTDGGSTWSTQSLVDPNADSDSNIDDTAPAAAWSSNSPNSVTVVWQSGPSSIKAAVSNDNGLSWSSSIVASATLPVMYSKPSLAHNGVYWIVVFEAKMLFG